MSGIFSDDTDEDSFGSCGQCDTSSSSVVSYDARYIYRLQQASKYLANTENHFYHNKVPLLEKLERRCVSLSMDLIATNETVFSYRFDDQIAMDNLMWTLRFAPFGIRGQYMMELLVQSEMADDVNWHAEVRIKVTLGGNMLSPLPKFNHPVRFSAQSPSLLVFVVDSATVKAWPSGLVQVDIYPHSLVGINIAPLFSAMGDPSDVAIRVHKGGTHRTFYVNRRWIERQSEWMDEHLNGKFAHGSQEVDVPDVSPRDFLLLLRGMERFEEDEMFHPDKIRNFLKLVDMFQAVPLQRTVAAALEDTRVVDLITKLVLADRYLPWPVVERILHQIEPFALRRSPTFDEVSIRLREEVIRLTSHHFPSFMAMGGGRRGREQQRGGQYHSKASPSSISTASNRDFYSASPSLSYQSFPATHPSMSYQSFDR